MIEKYRTITQEVFSCMGISIDIAQALQEQGDAAQVSELEDTIKEYINLEAKIKSHTTALAGLKNHINANNVKLGEAYKKLRTADKEPPDFKSHTKYKEFRQKIWAVDHPNQPLPDEQDEDIVLMNTQGNDNQFICPLTRSELDSPLKNNSCGHVYSKDAILDYMKRSKGKRGGKYPCPVAGCSAEVTQNSLERDLELERQLRRNKQRGGNPKKKKMDEDDITNLD